MKKIFFFCLTLALLTVAIVGCGTSTPTPAPQPTQPPVVITVVITATPPPATATPAGPTITPIPTVMPPTIAPITPVAQPTTAPISAGTPRPSATRRAPTVAVSPTPSALPLKYAAATLLEPVSERDERKFPSQALVFKWTPVLGLGADECYLLTVRFEAANPGGPSPRQDTFLSGCANQNIVTYPRQEMSMTLFQPTRGSPNYSSLLLDTSDIWVNWTITVVKNLGQCVDQYHCKTVPLSPASHAARFILRGG